MVQSGTTYRLVSDQLGSVRLVVDAATGVVAQRLDYDEWGGVLTDTNPGFQPFAFAGGHYDPDTGLLRFGARDYDPTVGRWTAKDPILFNGGGENLYQYADSDPVNLVDPTGNNPIAACLLNPNCVGGLTLLAAAWAAYVDACVRTGACDLKIPPFPSRPSRPSDWDASDQVCRAMPLPRAQPIPMDPYRPRPSPWRCSRLRASNSTCMYICRNPVTQQSRFHREAPGPDGCPDQLANFDP